MEKLTDLTGLELEKLLQNMVPNIKKEHEKKTLEYFESALRSNAMEGLRPSPEMQKLIDQVRSGEISVDEFKQKSIDQITKKGPSASS